jgi:hypothetical protein
MLRQKADRFGFEVWSWWIACEASFWTRAFVMPCASPPLRALAETLHAVPCRTGPHVHAASKSGQVWVRGPARPPQRGGAKMPTRRTGSGSKPFTQKIGEVLGNCQNCKVLCQEIWITIRPEVRINEVLANGKFPERDLIELFNASASDVDVGFWFLTDDPAQPKKYQLPSGTIIPAGGFLVIREAQFNPNPGVFPSFAFKAAGDEAGLYAANKDGDLTGYSDLVHLPASFSLESLGRWKTVGMDRMLPLTSPSWGSSNSAPEVGPLILSEVHYHAVSGTIPQPNDEYVELRNLTDQSVFTRDTSFFNSAWKLTGDVEFLFPPEAVVPPKGMVVIVSFDPATHPDQLESFRVRWNIPPTAMILGPYSGSLNHGGGTLRLIQPFSISVIEATGESIISERIVDEVAFDDEAGWPALADGQGASLHRRSLAPLAPSPSDWQAAAPSPGRVDEAAESPIITSSPMTTTPKLGGSVTLSVRATSAAPLHYQWRRNGEPIPGAVGSDLTLAQVQVTDVGCYDVVVMHGGGAVLSESANVWVQLPPDRHPKSGLRPSARRNQSDPLRRGHWHRGIRLSMVAQRPSSARCDQRHTGLARGAGRPKRPLCPAHHRRERIRGDRSSPARYCHPANDRDSASAHHCGGRCNPPCLASR